MFVLKPWESATNPQPEVIHTEEPEQSLTTDEPATTPPPVIDEPMTTSTISQTTEIVSATVTPSTTIYIPPIICDVPGCDITVGHMHEATREEIEMYQVCKDIINKSKTVEELIQNIENYDNSITDVRVFADRTSRYADGIQIYNGDVLYGMYVEVFYVCAITSKEKQLLGTSIGVQSLINRAKTVEELVRNVINCNDRITDIEVYKDELNFNDGIQIYNGDTRVGMIVRIQYNGNRWEQKTID
jgi:hypothetical protein